VPEELPGFGGIPLPVPAELSLSRTGNPKQRRALDYNLFAQDAFGNWLAQMVAAIRSTGSRQLVGVGQDEGGVGDRLLNQFYGAGVDFTSLHNWWNDDALLWDALAAKRPGTQSAGRDRPSRPSAGRPLALERDEGLGLFERKLVSRLAAGTGARRPGSGRSGPTTWGVRTAPGHRGWMRSPVSRPSLVTRNPT
jgi:hypothetical protein